MANGIIGHVASDHAALGLQSLKAQRLRGLAVRPTEGVALADISDQVKPKGERVRN